MTEKKITQKDMIRAWLKSGKRLTPIIALNEFGCFSLAQRIMELRREGLPICTMYKKDQKGGKMFAEYSLSNQEQ